MKELVEVVAKALVDNPDEVVVTDLPYNLTPFRLLAKKRRNTHLVCFSAQRPGSLNDLNVHSCVIFG